MYERYGEVGSVLSIRSLGNKVSFQFSAGISKAVCIVALILASATSAAEDATQYELNIAPQNIEQALRKLAEITGKELLFLFDQMESLESEQISGTYTIEDALAIILENTSLSGELTQDGVILITSKQKKSAGSAMDIKKAGLIAVVVSALTGGVNAQEPAVTEQEIQTSIVTGKVTDARTGANLKGAKVTIEETGQWTSTNDLGEFRLVNVPSGSATLTVSYLGYAGQSAVVGVRGDGVSQDFALRGGSEIEEIVVFGQRSARAIALNRERVSDTVSTVVSSDSLGNFGGRTISDALKKAPGVAFIPDPTTGDGVNIIVRGLEPDLNLVKINGIDLPVANGLDRSASLDTVLANSVESVTLSKTLLPSQDSSGTGAIIDIETKAPLDRARRFVSASVDVGGNDFVEDRNAGIILSGIFGVDEQFGLSVAVQYRERENETRGFGARFLFGEYLPLGPGGVPNLPSIDFINPLTAFPFEENANGLYPDSAAYTAALSETENTSIGISAQYRPSNSHDIRLDYQRLEAVTTLSTSNVDIRAPLQYALQPVAALGGEDRYALESTELFFLNHQYAMSEIYTQTDVLSLSGDWNWDKYEVDYIAGYALGEQAPRRSVTFGLRGLSATDVGFSTYLRPDATDPIEGRILSIFSTAGSGVVPLPLFTEEGYSVFNTASNYQFTGGNTASSASENERRTFEISLRRSFDHPTLSYVAVGGAFQNSRFDGTTTSGRTDYDPIGVVFASELGLNFAVNPVDSLANGFAALDPASLHSFRNELDAFGSGSDAVLTATPFVQPDGAPSFDDTFLEEEEVAIFLEVKLQFGRLDVVAGGRLSMIDAASKREVNGVLFDEFFSIDPDFSQDVREIQTASADQTEFLPRVAATFRASDNVLYRFGYFRSVARPNVSLMSDNEAVTIFLAPFFGSNFDQPSIAITRGNPGLRPAVTDSFDFSAEFYRKEGSAVKIGLFYKEISDPLRAVTTFLDEFPTNFTLPDDPRVLAQADNFDISVNTPINSPYDGRILGAELFAELQFVNLPGWMSGIGAFVNATYSESEIDEEASWITAPIFDDSGALVGTEGIELLVEDRPFDEQPEFSGTVGVTYNKYGFDGIVSYTYQDRRATVGFQRFSLSPYDDEVDSLDMRVEYTLERGNGQYAAFFEGRDLLRSSDEYEYSNSIGGENGAIEALRGATYRGGRSLFVGVRASF